MGQQIDGSIMNEVREAVRIIKSETNTLLQKSVRKNSNPLPLKTNFLSIF